MGNKCPRCEGLLKLDRNQQKYVCSGCGFEVPRGEDEDVDWDNRDEKEYD